MIPVELAITLKNDKLRVTIPHLLYTTVVLDPSDPTIQRLIQEAKEAFLCEQPPDSISIKCRIEIQ